MVQRKVPNYKLVIKASSSLKTEKNPSPTINPSSQNHDANAKEPDLPKKMKQSPPNYMKSTSCSEARKQKKQVPKELVSCASSSSFSSYDGAFDQNMPSRSLNRTSSLKKARFLTKASRSTKSVNKSSTATCSSALKDGKFPLFLDLNPGGTESQGTSVVKVCPYNRCSLNEHKHDSNPPLKSFLSSRRRLLKKMPCEDDGETKEDVGVDLVVDNETGEAVTLLFAEEKDDFFLEIYVKQAKEGEGHEKSVFEVGYEGDLDQEKEAALVDMDFGNTSSKGEGGGGEDGMLHECEYDGGNFDWENAISITALYELFAECSDVESEKERRLYLTGLGIGDGNSAPSDQESDLTFLSLLDEEGVNKDDLGIEFCKEFLAEESDEFSQDEITNCYVQFSDSESSVNDVYDEKEFDQFLQYFGCSDKKIAEAEDEDEDEIVKDSLKSDDQTISNTKISEESSINEVVCEFLSNHLQALEGITSCQDDFEQASEETPEEQPPSYGDFEALGIGQELKVTDQVQENTPLIDIENSGFTMQAASPDSEEESGIPNTKNLKAMNRSRNQGENSKALKLFNTREPNYLEVEPDVEAEKVDLRHQEMDEKRNAEEWMLDYALRKAVNQLTPDRKRKVALLVEAFETVIPPTQL